MTDTIILPGTKMEVFEKYPASWRLDHPNFGDVAKTTFVKGTITDFQKLTEDPLKVEPMVKVKFGDEEQESEFIPISYQPRAHYWDCADAQAKDFNKDTGAFKQAWMSFRGGDEVVVMLKEGVPVAVLGFTDGVPRSGENVFMSKHSFAGWLNYFNDDLTEAYDPPILMDADPSPTSSPYYGFKNVAPDPVYPGYVLPKDGFIWKLWQAGDGVPDKVFNPEIACVTPKFKFKKTLTRETVLETGWKYTYEGGEYDNCADNPAYNDEIFEVVAIFTYGQTIEREYTLEYYWAIGPVVYCFQKKIVYTLFQGQVYRAYYHMGPVANGAIACDPTYHALRWYGFYGPYVYPDWDVDPNTLDFTTVVEVGHHGVYQTPLLGQYASWWEFPSEEMVDGFSSSSYDHELFAAIYTPEFWEAPSTSKMTRQTDLSIWMGYIAPLPDWAFAFNEPESVKFLSPPHSKEELEAAGMWPEKEQAA